MSNYLHRVNSFYINGQWVDASSAKKLALLDPATEAPVADLAMGTADDVDRAVAAARTAFPAYSRTTAKERIELLTRILHIYTRREEEFAEAMRVEMGSPITFSRHGQVVRGPAHLKELIRVLERFKFEVERGTTRLRYEPIGVCGLITPWNWPINQIVVKIGPALAAGCTMVLKPSEFSALSALLFAEVLEEAGVPPGVFNLVNGYGDEVGHAIAAHPDIDMVSFTGSTLAGIQVAKTAAETVKRVAQELGGKSANLLLEDADFDSAVAKGVAGCFTNSGQSCSIPTRMLVPRTRIGQVIEQARAVAEAYVVGPTQDPETQLGPLVNRSQFERVQKLIQSGIDEGAQLVTGGLGRPAGLEQGYFVKPTVFANVSPEMRIAQEEIFGPVLSIIPYDSEEQAIQIANDTRYGLAAYVQSENQERARHVARQLKAGSVHINYPPADFGAPFGGYKQSGNGREWGEFGMIEYLEVKSMVGFCPSETEFTNNKRST
ncbi:aldehyde dehydrogenase family protein [Alcaligenes sp. 13f]|uniref:aldehyde dehydrogenase family protein n=1 Tax=Alcaligenes sp. 13f TaxID=2841924 RepID=UPI001CF6FCB7|nr:aldehyde dehydrogenase family protein [Alcaligenes sp. 13f]MCB4322007.1 aldehyde dehydrogenase family protein [Alcaligenes sp. 13f]